MSRNQNSGGPSVNTRGRKRTHTDANEPLLVQNDLKLKDVHTSCKPPEFAGTEGAVVALRWLETIEAVIAISKCAEEDMVLYASNSFKDGALEWWNSIIQTKGRTNAYAMTWESFRDLVTRKFCPMNEKEQIERKFLTHRMVGAGHHEYTSKYFEYARLVPHLVTPESNLISRYIWGLVSEIMDMVKAAMPQTIDSAVELAGLLIDGIGHYRTECPKLIKASGVSGASGLGAKA
ncbi:hypothetical protein E3N88_39749 [Mikania micrantha]|uniref:Ty3 transposon capsid-like protein domain-containing protein n=1 Tax=Mikania micrantha TaxID=192012 RepID=A0A5N6LKN7_9ASTR|nr:hypothetical protein E3N88_39749 [Mikania micrantha]